MFVSLTLVLVLLVVLVLFGYSVLNTASRASERASCAVSVREASAMRVNVDNFLTALDCPTVDVKLKGNDYEIKKQLADLILDAYEDFGYGKYPLVSEAPGRMCVFRYLVSFDEGNREIKGFLHFLDQTNAKGKYDEEGKPASYLYALAAYHTEDSFDALSREAVLRHDNMAINTSKKYAVVMVYSGDTKTMMESLSDVVADGSLQGAADATAAAYTTNTVLAFGKAYMDKKGKGLLGTIASKGSKVVGKTLWYVGRRWLLLQAGEIAGEAIWDNLNRQYFFPDWSAAIVLREYSAEDLKDLGCSYLPAKQK